MNDLLDTRELLADAIALIAFLQQIASLAGSMDERSKAGLFLFVNDILDRLQEVEKRLTELKKQK